MGAVKQAAPGDKGHSVSQPVCPVEARYTISPDIVDCPLGDGLALFDARNGTSFSLNRTGALIWQMARKPTEFRELQAMLLAACKGTPADIEADLRAIVNALIDVGLFRLVSPHLTEAAPAHAP